MFVSNSLDKLVETLVNNSHKSIKNLKKELVGDDNILKFVNEIENLFGREKNIRTNEDKKNLPK